eukprot:235236_1
MKVAKTTMTTEKLCPLMHTLSVIKNRIYSVFANCKLCGNHRSSSDVINSWYQCECQHWYVCNKCYKTNMITFNWMILCYRYKELASYSLTCTQSNAISAVSGYCRLIMQSINYSHDDMANIVLMYFWEYYSLKEYFDKYNSYLVSNELYHLRPLIQMNAIGLIQYILNKTNSKYINCIYPVSNRHENSSILWDIITLNRSATDLSVDKIILKLCKNYKIDPNEHSKNLFLKFTATFWDSHIIIRYIDRLQKIFETENDIEFNINYVDESIANYWWGVTAYLINNNCQITDKCYDIYLNQYLLKERCRTKELNKIDINNKNECFKLVFLIYSHHERMSAARLLYNKYNDINMNYLRDVAEIYANDYMSDSSKWTELFFWMIEHNATIS